MSIFDRLCAEATSGLICAHIEHFYKSVGGETAVFYILNDNELPAGSNIIATLSDTGDECHREVTGIGNGPLKKAFKDRVPEQFFICDDDGFRPLTQEDIANFTAA
jgi:hypothetical protein